MKKPVRIFCTLLSLILLLTGASLLGACKKENPANQPDTTTGAPGDSSPECT